MLQNKYRNLVLAGRLLMIATTATGCIFQGDESSVEAQHTQEDTKCVTIHSGSPIELNSKNLKFVIPVAYNLNNSNQSFTTIVLPSAQNYITATLVFKDTSGWHYSEKYQVVALKSKSKIDFSPNLRITAGDRRLLVLKIPIDKFRITLQPVVGGSKVAGETVTYPVSVTANGIDSPFQDLMQSAPGVKLLPELSELLDKTRSGDLLLPDRFARNISVSATIGVESNKAANECHSAVENLN